MRSAYNKKFSINHGIPSLFQPLTTRFFGKGCLHSTLRLTVLPEENLLKNEPLKEKVPQNALKLKLILQ